MSLYKPPNSNFWWSDLRHNGKRLRETTYMVDKAQAQIVHNRRQMEIWAQDSAPGTGCFWSQARDAWLNSGAQHRVVGAGSPRDQDGSIDVTIRTARRLLRADALQPQKETS